MFVCDHVRAHVCACAHASGERASKRARLETSAGPIAAQPKTQVFVRVVCAVKQTTPGAGTATPLTWNMKPRLRKGWSEGVGGRYVACVWPTGSLFSMGASLQARG